MNTKNENYEGMAIQFAVATKKKSLNDLQAMLVTNGKYDIQNDHLETETVGRREFLLWYMQKLETTEIIDIKFDHCKGCFFGNRTLLFNHGTFPRIIKNNTERSKAGLMLYPDGNKIQGVKFCFGFMKEENKYVFENSLEEIQKMEQEFLKPENLKVRHKPLVPIFTFPKLTKEG